MKSIFLLSFIVSLCSCRDHNKIDIIQPTGNVKDTFVVITECVQRDTVTELGTQIRYLHRNGKFQVTWGNSNYSRTYDSLFSCDYDTLSGVWDFVPKYNSETQNALVLTDVLATSSGGNPAPVEFSALVLPKNAVDSVYIKDFWIDCIGDYLIYGDERDDRNIHILNLETKKGQDFILNPRGANFKSPTISVRETKINGNTLSIKYETFKWVADTAVVVTKTFKLKI